MPFPDATETAAMVARGEMTPTDLLDAALAATARLNPLLNAVTLLQEDVARRAIADGLPQGPFRGVPFLLKDLGAEARDFPSHMGSRLFANTRFSRDSALWDRMRATGVVTFGRTTAPEGGIGAATEAAVYGGPTRNPWNPDHTPGGSSGGAAAAVAAGIVPFAHGSDGGGSVRIPAACCGLFGMKPTRARLPDGPYGGEGWAGMAIEGFLTRSVRDTAVMLDACHGADLGAPYWAPPLRTSHADAISRPPRRLRVMLCDTTFTGDPIDPQVRLATLAAARLLDSLGHHVEPGLPRADIASMMRAWTDIVGIGTALSVRGKTGGRRPTPDECEGVTRGAFDHAETLHPTRYLQAVGEIHDFGRQMAAVFDPPDGPAFDIILSPTLAEPPARVGRFAHTTTDYLGYRIGPQGVFAYSPYCAVFNASGQPAASLPLAMSRDGLPIGIHIAARFGDDEMLIALCAEIERAAPWAHHIPPIHASIRGKCLAPGRIAPLRWSKQRENRVTAAKAIEVVNAVKAFGQGDHAVRALDDVSLTIRTGEFFTLLGPSGCGKTTLLRLIAGFETPTSGSILLDGQDITHLPPNRRAVNTVFQSYALFPHLTVAENVAFGLQMLGKPRSEVTARTAEMLVLVKLDAMANRKTSQLSGGQQQRVALARALAPQPKVLLLDEPLSALDLKLRKEMQVELKRLQTETGITFVFVTHDQEEALTMSDRIGVMSAGKLQQLGPPREIYTRPVNRFVASFIGDTNFLPGTASPGGVHLASGSTVPVDSPRSGPVTLAVRPEHVQIDTTGTPGAIPATVRGSVYFGTDMNYRLQLADGTEIEACVVSGVTGEALLSPGQPVGLRFTPGAVQVLED